MARHGGATEVDERAVGHDRLRAMRLRSDVAGWVPEPVAAAYQVPAAAVSQPVAEAPAVAPRIAPSPSDRRTPAVPTFGELAKGWAEDRLPPWSHGLLDRLRLGSLLAGLAVILAVAALGVMALHHRAPTGYPASSYDASAASSTYPADPVASAIPSAASDASSIVVDVGGRVRKPGLVTLPAGSRVADALAAAGGPLHRKEIATLDLAARVSDGQLLLVGETSAPPDGSATGADDGDGTAAGPAEPVSLSTATMDELETLPGVGPVTAQKIIDWRTANDGFSTVEQLQEVSGIGPAKYAELSPLVTP
jgi:competence protein ComEA